MLTFCNKSIKQHYWSYTTHHLISSFQHVPQLGTQYKLANNWILYVTNKYSTPFWGAHDEV